MDSKIHDELVNLYDPNYIGVIAIKDILSTQKIKLIRDGFELNTDKFYSLEYGNVSRWDLSEDDFCKFPALELVRREFRQITSEISLITELNPVYKEKFSILLYPEGSSGVKPHRDSEHSVNCVLIFIISGDNMFLATSDTSSEEVTQFSTQPGDVIIMRGPRNSEDGLSRPVHSIGDVATSRYVMVCRHINLEGLKS